MTETIQSPARRRGARVAMRVPVELRCTRQDGSVFEESTHTGVVGPLGAMVRASRALPVGAEVVLTNRFSQQTARFRIVSIAEQPQADGLWDIGIESLGPLDDFWGVRFPPRPDLPV